MNHIRSEMRMMKARIEKERDKRGEKTEEELSDWFKREAIRLEGENNQMRQEIKGLKMKVERIEEEKRFFQRIAKEAKKMIIMKKKTVEGIEYKEVEKISVP